MSLGHQFCRLYGMHDMTPYVPVVHIGLVDTLGGLKLGDHQLEEAEVVQYLKLPLRPVQR